MSNRIHKFRAWDINKKKWIGDTGTTFNSEKAIEGQVALLLSGNLRVFTAEHIGSGGDCERGDCLVAVANSEYESVHPVRVNYKKQYILLEFTNLHDKNGKDPTVELYHKDLMRVLGGIFIIEWRDSSGWVLEDERGASFISLYKAINEGDGVKVGNFYSNPDLLKGKQRKEEKDEQDTSGKD